jgi:hypothetical protein
MTTQAQNIFHFSRLKLVLNTLKVSKKKLKYHLPDPNLNF